MKDRVSTKVVVCLKYGHLSLPTSVHGTRRSVRVAKSLIVISKSQFASLVCDIDMKSTEKWKEHSAWIQAQVL